MQKSESTGNCSLNMHFNNLGQVLFFSILSSLQGTAAGRAAVADGLMVGNIIILFVHFTPSWVGPVPGYHIGYICQPLSYSELYQPYPTLVSAFRETPVVSF